VRKPYIGPLDKALWDGMCFGEGMTKAFFISSMLQRIEDLTSLLENDSMGDEYKRATELLLEQLETTFYTCMRVSGEDLESGRKNI
jgi:hypothetical protein